MPFSMGRDHGIDPYDDILSDEMELSEFLEYINDKGYMLSSCNQFRYWSQKKENIRNSVYMVIINDSTGHGIVSEKQTVSGAIEDILIQLENRR